VLHCVHTTTAICAGKEIRFKIFRNIGTAFVRMGQYHDAIGAYETVMQGSADALTGFNLVLCYYALEDTAQMKKAFVRLVAIPIQVCVDILCTVLACGIIVWHCSMSGYLHSTV
jgi:hypothetical protein